MEHINLAIFAHVDAGKTTITENMLYLSGTNKTLGRVDKGTSSTDSLDVERERGISIRTASACFNWKNVMINIIDTPGHIDFSSEIERALLAPDISILVISAVEGIQAQTQSIWEVLKKRKIPVILFINKIDRLGAEPDIVLEKLKDELMINTLSTQKLIESEGTYIDIENSFSENIIDRRIIEKLSENDDELMEMFIEDISPPFELLKSKLKGQIQDAKIFPVLFGSAIKNQGIKELLDFLVHYFPYSERVIDVPLSAVIFKIEHHKTLGRLASVRLFRGKIINKDTVYNNTLKQEEKVNNIIKIFSQKMEDTGEVFAGDISILSGLKNSQTGDILGDPEFVPEKNNLNVSVIKVLVIPENEKQYPELTKALQILADEDPILNLQWNKVEKELYIKIMGKIQIEVIESILLSRFNLKVIFGDPIIIYKETLTVDSIGFEEYTMPKPCWAIVKFSLQPGKMGSGIKYSSSVSFDKIAQRYQMEIERSLSSALKQGPLGWEATDLEIELIDGEHHNIHSRAGDFSIATHIAFMKGLSESKTKLLEPMLNFRIDVQQDYLNRVSSELFKIRAEILENISIRDNAIIKGLVPVSTSIDLPIKIGSLTGGLGKYQTSFSGYKECTIEDGKTRKYIGINPLERSKFILSARKAL